MRSGQYKLSSSKMGSKEELRVVTVSHFRSSSKDLNGNKDVPASLDLPLMFVQQKNGSPVLYQKEQEALFRRRSCENVSASRDASKVEQKVRSLLLREPKRRVESPVSSPAESFEAWPAGRLVLHRKPRLSSSHATLPCLNSSDTASCLSASSGYSSSSSNSSSYGSFKSCTSANSTLPRNRSLDNQSPMAENDRILFADNPLYDVTPATALPGMQRLHIPNSLEYYQNIGEVTDPIAQQCKEYFEKRLKSSESLRRRFSTTSSRPSFASVTSERDKHPDCDLISKGDAIVDSKLSGGFGLQLNFCVEPHIPIVEGQETVAKGFLDQKMDFLRQEIASLIQQDHSLFRQLLSLHETISDLKKWYVAPRNDFPGVGIPRPLTPSDLESFTEEDEGEEDQKVKQNDHWQERQLNVMNAHSKSMSPSPPLYDLTAISGQLEMAARSKHDPDEDEDEGHVTDLSRGQSPNHSSHTPSPASTLSSNSSKGSSYSRKLCSEFGLDGCATFTRCRKSYAPTARNRRRTSSVHYPRTPPLDCGTTTALVVISADHDTFISSSRQRSHSYTPLTGFSQPHDALCYAEAKQKALRNKGGEVDREATKGRASKVTTGSCSSQTVATRHSSYREALIM